MAFLNRYEMYWFTSVGGGENRFHGLFRKNIIGRNSDKMENIWKLFTKLVFES